LQTTDNEGLHFLSEEPHQRRTENFVVFCSECTCVLRVSRGHIETGAVMESLVNRCPGCGAALDRVIAERTMLVSEDWGEISLSVSVPRTRRDNFRSANSLRGFRSGIARLDAVVEPLEPGRLAVLQGWPAGALAELLCFRAQLPAAAGGMDSTVVYVDGGNCSDLYLFAGFARRAGMRPEKALKRVMISRAFTVYQLADLLTRELPRMVEERGSKLVVASGALSMFGDPSISQAEGNRVASAVGAGLQSLRRSGALVVATLNDRTPYDRRVTSQADIVLDFTPGRNGVSVVLSKHPKRREAAVSIPAEAFGLGGLEVPRLGKDRPFL
jgi:hypothetical protein